MTNLCLHFNESQPTYAYKRYDYITECSILPFSSQHLLIYNYITDTLEERHINIALDDDITFIIKACEKYLLASENYIQLLRFFTQFYLLSYSVFLLQFCSVFLLNILCI